MCFQSSHLVGTGVGGLCNPSHDIQEPLVVIDMHGRPPGELGVRTSVECDNFTLECFDTVGLAIGREFGL